MRRCEGALISVMSESTKMFDLEKSETKVNEGDVLDVVARPQAV